jgi:hypothetical protein
LVIAPWVGIAFFAGSDELWFIPDKRIERFLFLEGL